MRSDVHFREPAAGASRCVSRSGQPRYQRVFSYIRCKAVRSSLVPEQVSRILLFASAASSDSITDADERIQVLVRRSGSAPLSWRDTCQSVIKRPVFRQSGWYRGKISFVVSDRPRVQTQRLILRDVFYVSGNPLYACPGTKDLSRINLYILLVWFSDLFVRKPRRTPVRLRFLP